jgi:membrane-associated phospholipid phosphatase
VRMRSLLDVLTGLDETYSTRTALKDDQLSAGHPLFWLAHIGAHLGDSVLWLLVTLFLWRQSRGNQRKRSTLVGWILSFAGGLLGTMLVKQAVRRPRPGSGRFLYAGGADAHSFPSGHGVRCGVILTWASVFWPGAGKLAPLLVLWISWARVALNIHYIGDIVAGFLLGAGLSRIIRGRALGKNQK